MTEKKKLTETQIALERVNEADFEQIVCSHVRRSNPERYSMLIQLGLNQEGKSVHSKIDGFCLVPGSNPPEYVLLAITTTQLKSLKGKLFSESEKNRGDLIKALKKATEIRESQPEATFEVLAATNRHINEELSTEITSMGEEWFKVIPVEQTQLLDFLDNSSDGQYIRHKYFGIPLKRLSIDLLREIGYSTLKSHAKAFKVPNSDQIIDREALDPMKLRGNLTILLGRSGYGKSTAANKLLKYYLDIGELGIWISAKYYDKSLSLKHAIASALQDNVHGLSFEEAMRAFDLLTNSGLTLYVLVDDINRTENPPIVMTELIQNIVVGDNVPKSPLFNGECQTLSRGSLHLILPIRKSYWQLLENEIKDSNNVNIISIERYSQKEIYNLSGKILPKGSKQLDMDQIAEELAYDPYLIGLIIDSASSTLESLQLPINPWDIQEEFLRFSLNDVKVRTSTQLLINDLLDTLVVIASAIIYDRTLLPHIRTIEEFAEKKGLNISESIRILIRDGNLIGIDSDENITFRHDRFRDFLVGKFIVGEVEKEKNDLGVIISTDWFSDLY